MEIGLRLEEFAGEPTVIPFSISCCIFSLFTDSGGGGQRHCLYKEEVCVCVCVCARARAHTHTHIPAAAAAVNATDFSSTILSTNLLSHVPSSASETHQVSSSETHHVSS